MTAWPLAPPLPRPALVAELTAQCAAAGLPAPARRYRVGSWTWALAWPGQRLLVELLAGRYDLSGRLLRGLTYPQAEKLNAATLSGYRVLTCGPQSVADGTAVVQIEHALAAVPYGRAGSTS